MLHLSLGSVATMWGFSENAHLHWSVMWWPSIRLSTPSVLLVQGGPLEAAILPAETRQPPGACLPHGSSLSLGLTPPLLRPLTA